MNLQVRLAFQGDLNTFARETHLRIARGARTGAERQQAQAKLGYRGAVRALDDKIANAVRVDVQPRSASSHTHAPAVYVWTKAPKIIFAFSTGVTITHHSGLWLAIPTENTPKRGRRRMTPAEVEVIFNQKLITLPGKGGQLLGFVDAVKSKSGRFRRATNARTGRQSKKAELVLMFVFVRQARLTKRIDWDGVTRTLTSAWPENFGGEIAKALKD